MRGARWWWCVWWVLCVRRVSCKTMADGIWPQRINSAGSSTGAAGDVGSLGDVLKCLAKETNRKRETIKYNRRKKEDGGSQRLVDGDERARIQTKRGRCCRTSQTWWFSLVLNKGQASTDRHDGGRSRSGSHFLHQCDKVSGYYVLCERHSQKAQAVSICVFCLTMLSS